jgi:predicted ribosome quality control (RQC) complex YloA/Tae2 family protein
MEVTSTCFYYIQKILEEELAGGYINNVQNITDAILKIKIHHKNTKQLIVTKDVCFLSTDFKDVENNNGFTKYLKKTLYNQKIHSINQDKNNRLLYLTLDKYILIFEFFSNSNIILTDLNLKILSAKQSEEWKDRIIKRGKTYIFPATIDINTTSDIVLKELIQKKIPVSIATDKKEIISFFVKECNIHPHYLESIWQKHNKTMTIDTIIKELRELQHLKNPSLEIVNSTKNKKIGVVSDSNIKKTSGDFFTEIIKEQLSTTQPKEIKKTNLKKCKIENILKEQEAAVTEFESQIKRLDQEGVFIYANFVLIDEINNQINLALNKKITLEKIIATLNNYFQIKKIRFNIKQIDLKNKKYTLTY